MYNKIKVPEGTQVNTIENWKHVIEELIKDLKGTNNINDHISSIEDMNKRLPDTPLLVIDNSNSFDVNNALSVDEAGRLSDEIDILNIKLDKLDTDNSPEYLEFEGNNINCIGTLEGRTNNMVITGGCLFNYLKSYNEDIQLNSKITLIPSNADKRVITLKLNACLVPGTYTLYFTTLYSSTNKEVKVYGQDPKGLLYPFVDNTNVSKEGLSTATFFINKDRYLDNLKLYLDYDESDKGKIEICNLMLFKGDYTGQIINNFVRRLQNTTKIKVASRNDNFIINGRFKDKYKYWKGYQEGHMDLSKEEFRLNMKSTKEYNFSQEIDAINPGHSYIVDFNYKLEDYIGDSLRVELLYYQDSVLIKNINILEAKDRTSATNEFKKLRAQINIPNYINKVIFKIHANSCSGIFTLKDPLFTPNLDLDHYIEGFYDEQDIDDENCYLQNIENIQDKIMMQNNTKLTLVISVGQIFGQNIVPTNIVSRGEYILFDYLFDDFGNVDNTKELVSDSFTFLPSVDLATIYEGVGYIQNGFRFIVKSSKIGQATVEDVTNYLKKNKPRLVYAKKNHASSTIKGDYTIDLKTLNERTYIYARATNNCKISFRVPVNMYSIIENNIDAINKLEYIFDTVVDPFFNNKK